MCGFCIESQVVLDLMERERQGEIVAVDDHAVGAGLQEATNLADYLRQIGSSINFPLTQTLAWCRAWETLIQYESVDDFGVVASAYGQSNWEAMLTSLPLPAGYPPLAVIREPSFYRDISAWHTVMQDLVGLTEMAERVLSAYKARCLAVEDPDSESVLPNSAQQNANRLNIQWFQQEFPLLFISLVWLSYQQPKTSILRDIALMSSTVGPDFTGCDLWLQRKAFLVCLNSEGIHFLLNHFEQIRFELMYYALLKGAIDQTDYEALAERLQKAEYPYVNCQASHVLQLMERLHAEG